MPDIETREIRVMIADDHPVVRAGLVRLLTDAPGINVTCEAGDGDALLARIESAPADVLLIDISMPGPGFLKTLQTVQAKRPGLPVLVLSVHPAVQYEQRALDAGARGYVTKDRSPEELEQAIRVVHGGGIYQGAGPATPLPHSTLSSREYQVLCLIGGGLGVTEIGADLALSPKTVSTYRSRILKKLELKNNADLMRYVIQHGLEG